MKALGYGWLMILSGWGAAVYTNGWAKMSFALLMIAGLVLIMHFRDKTDQEVKARSFGVGFVPTPQKFRWSYIIGTILLMILVSVSVLTIAAKGNGWLTDKQITSYLVPYLGVYLVGIFLRRFYFSKEKCEIP